MGHDNLSFIDLGAPPRLTTVQVFPRAIGARAAELLLRRIAADDKAPSELREKAVFWLGQPRSAGNAQYLRGLFDKLAGAPEGSSNEAIRQKILFSLSQMRGEGNDEWLLQVATNPKHSVETRKQALFSAGQAGVSSRARGERR